MYTQNSKWLTVLNADQPTDIRLICFAQEGAGPDPFCSWAGGLNDHIELLIYTLPGHGKRQDETPYSEWSPLLADSFTALKSYLSEPHALFGHGLGAILAYELARLSEAQHPGQTRHLFISGCRSPDSQPVSSLLHSLLSSNRSLSVPLTAIYGSEDPLAPAESMVNWREFTRREFELIEVTGNHLFITPARQRLLQIVNTHLGLLSE
ncbi:thioesterase II family protein [Pseudomonas sp. H11T01]|uniref:thioesterase II family protein n=1 Tax=Pseudomonas sp. H11T01 TaxID=3402749 RepID=UPI003AC83DF7